MTRFIDQFLADVSRHQMQVIRDDGTHRHLRFARPGTGFMHFDLITWPGHLCYTGDMGTFVFRRLTDMFEFFRRRKGATPFRIDLSYWAEKIEASDREGVRVWTPQEFRAQVRAYFEANTVLRTEDEKSALWIEISEKVCDAADESEQHAWTSLWGFDHEGWTFDDWCNDCKVWTHRFKWCCCALEWAIGVYDDLQITAAPAPVREVFDDEVMDRDGPIVFPA